jgi:hypothetical protein
MRTIHFAHWAFVSNGSRLMFLSNFDHSWDSYLDDFIEKAHGGLTLAWGSGVGFPPTRFPRARQRQPRPAVQELGAALHGGEPVLVQRLQGLHRQPDRTSPAASPTACGKPRYAKGGRRMGGDL